MITNSKETFLREHFDYSDRETLSLLAESESNQDKMLVALTSKLYEKILEKYDKIDFSSISRSRGDITKVEKYDSLVECVDIIQKLVTQYNENTAPVDVVSGAIANIKQRTDLFKKSYLMNCSVGIVTYNTMVLSIIESVSFLISTCIEYVKVPSSETFQMALDTIAYNNTRGNLLFEGLGAFNAGCASGEFDASMKVALTEKRVANEAAEIAPDCPFLSPDEEDGEDDNKVVVHDDSEELEEGFIDGIKGFGDKIYNAPIWDKMSKFGFEAPGKFGDITSKAARAFLFFGKFLIPALRTLVYFHYDRRQKKSDYYGDMAQLIQMNMLQLQNDSTIDVDKKKKILDRQQKIYEKYMKKKNKYSIEYNVSKKSTEKMIKDEDKKVTIKDINFDSTDSYSASDSVLF